MLNDFRGGLCRPGFAALQMVLIVQSSEAEHGFDTTCLSKFSTRCSIAWRQWFQTAEITAVAKALAQRLHLNMLNFADVAVTVMKMRPLEIIGACTT